MNHNLYVFKLIVMLSNKSHLLVNTCLTYKYNVLFIVSITLYINNIKSLWKNDYCHE